MILFPSFSPFYSSSSSKKRFSVLSKSLLGFALKIPTFVIIGLLNSVSGSVLCVFYIFMNRVTDLWTCGISFPIVSCPFPR